MKFLVFVIALMVGGAAHAQTANRVTTCGSGTPPAGNSSVYMDANGNLCTNVPTTTPSTQSAGTVTTGATFQTALPANPSRTSCLIQNTSAHTAYVYWLATGTASLTNAVQISAGASFSCINPSGAPIRTAIQWTTGTTGDAFVVTENQ